MNDDTRGERPEDARPGQGRPEQAAPDDTTRIDPPPGGPDEPFDQTQRFDPQDFKENPMEQRLLGGRYEVGELLGRGGMAEVHAGRDTRLGRTVAIKSLRVDLARDPSFQNRFRREAQSAASLNHPNIVAIYDTGEEADPAHGGLSVPYIVMESVEGTTLRTLLNEGRRLMPERALEITSGVLAALDYSHRAGIVHRDIKPANVMLTPDGEVKVMDFGIARAVADPASTMTQTGATLGTAQYLSPEQAQGGTVDPRSDIYSTGCMLYELLTGRPPFTGDSPVSVAYQHVRENPVPPSQIDPDISPTIDAIVMKALAKNADNRYQSASEMRADIERALGGRPVAATPVMDETRAIGTVAAADVTPDEGSNRGRKIGFALLGLAVLGLLIGGVFALMNLGGGATQVTVPNLEGLKVPAAEKLLAEKNLVLGEPVERESDAPTGTIIEQSPAFPASVAEGSTVEVVISKGPASTKVPVVIGLPLDTAVQRLEKAGLVVAETKRRDSVKPANEVLAVEPGEGATVDKGSAVTLFVSTAEVAVPEVVGKSEAQARAEITRVGLEVTTESRITDNEDQVGNVISQNPQSGKLPAGGTVVITVGAARPAPPTPTAEPTEEPSATADPTDPADEPDQPTRPNNSTD